MFALIDNEQITKHISGNKGITIGDVQYPRSIFTLWSEAERNAIGIYVITIDTTNKKDEKYYINTNVSYGVESNKAVGSYGTATAKALADANATDDDGVELDPVVVIEGLKTKHKRIIKQQASGLLTNYDWYVIRKADAGTAVPSAITTYRAAVRTKSGQMETAIDNAANVDALAALYKYVNTGTEENPVMERPLGEFPEAV